MTSFVPASPATTGPTPTQAPPLTRRVLALGVFDLFHVGHLRYLRHARAQGSHLSVAVCTDAFCQQLKHRTPVVPEAQRLEIVQGLACVDRADLQPALVADTQATAHWMSAWGIDLVMVGQEWQDSPRWATLGPVLAARGIALGFAAHTPDVSTSALRARVGRQGEASP